MAATKPGRGYGRSIVKDLALRVAEHRERWRVTPLPEEILPKRQRSKVAPMEPGPTIDYPETSIRCWFCDVPYEASGPLRITEEHLVARSRGGTNRGSNVVYAHGLCNELAGDISFEEKLIFREILHRAGAPMTTADRRAVLTELLCRIDPEAASPKARFLWGSSRYRRPEIKAPERENSGSTAREGEESGQ